jgi:hypothetical protein
LGVAQKNTEILNKAFPYMPQDSITKVQEGKRQRRCSEGGKKRSKEVAERWMGRGEDGEAETRRQVEVKMGWWEAGREVKERYPKIWFSLQNSETEKMWVPGTSKNSPLYRAL